MKYAFGSLVSLIVLCMAALAADDAWPGVRGNWRGFSAYTFDTGGHQARVIAPEKSAEGKPWVLLAGAEPGDVEEALVRDGYHVATVELPDPFGSPGAVEAWNAVYAVCAAEKGLAEKAVLGAYGHGGLIAHNWAVENRPHVAAVYALDPVFDFRSWPGVG